MDNKNVNKMIVKSLEVFDIQNNKYKKFINSKNTTVNKDDLTINFNDLSETFNYQMLGIFIPETNVWIWSWMIPNFTSKEIIMTKNLLNYGLKQTKDNLNDQFTVTEMDYLKVQLVNSRFLINKKFQLESHIAICSYLLKENIKFIYTKKVMLTDKKFIFMYYLIY